MYCAQNYIENLKYKNVQLNISMESYSTNELNELFNKNEIVYVTDFNQKNCAKQMNDFIYAYNTSADFNSRKGISQDMNILINANHVLTQKYPLYKSKFEQRLINNTSYGDCLHIKDQYYALTVKSKYYDYIKPESISSALLKLFIQANAKNTHDIMLSCNLTYANWFNGTTNPKNETSLRNFLDSVLYQTIDTAVNTGIIKKDVIWNIVLISGYEMGYISWNEAQ